LYVVYGWISADQHLEVNMSNNKQNIKNRIKHLIAKTLFGEPMVMSIYQDKYGNNFGGVIHKDDGKSYVDSVKHIEDSKYLGEAKIYL
jgi:hypothetical protein